MVIRRLVLGILMLTAHPLRSGESATQQVATFSIVAADPTTREVGVAVASKFFAVGSVVPWVRAGAGAVATQSYANTEFGPGGLDLMQAGTSPEDVINKLMASDPGAARRQVGMVSADGQSATTTGSACVSWAGGRSGPNYAVQGNILTGEDVVLAMERSFVASSGDLAQRLLAALTAGDKAGGDSRGRQSAALLVARPSGGYGGYNDRYIDLRVDDHPDPLGELGRLLAIAHVNASWNLAWTAFSRGQHELALPHMELTTELARKGRSSVLGEVLYDLAVIRAAGGKTTEALAALGSAFEVNPKLRAGARTDKDLKPLHGIEGFAALVDVD